MLALKSVLHLAALCLAVPALGAQEPTRPSPPVGPGVCPEPLPEGARQALTGPMFRPDFAPSPETPESRPAPGLLRRPAGFEFKDLPPFLGGALVGLVLHESGHYAMDLALGTDPYVKRVDTGGIPFFAVTYRKEVTPRQEYAIAAAGFWVQHGMAEAILAKYPRLWQEAPTSIKGAFAFHLVTSLIYGYAALAKSGPPERDTLGMAHGLDLHERWVGLAVLLPAALDLYRSFHPDTPGANWTSRGVKLGFVFALTR